MRAQFDFTTASFVRGKSPPKKAKRGDTDVADDQAIIDRSLEALLVWQRLQECEPGFQDVTLEQATELMAAFRRELHALRGDSTVDTGLAHMVQHKLFNRPWANVAARELNGIRYYLKPDVEGGVGAYWSCCRADADADAAVHFFTDPGEAVRETLDLDWTPTKKEIFGTYAMPTFFNMSQKTGGWVFADLGYHAAVFDLSSGTLYGTFYGPTKDHAIFNATMAVNATKTPLQLVHETAQLFSDQ